jgi:phage tail protein X
MRKPFRIARSIGVVICVLMLNPGHAVEDDIFRNRPAFSMPDQPPAAAAQCHEIRKMSAGLPKMEDRIDFSSEGTLTLVKSDGALWYLVMCSDVRVMCVTYEGNDMKAGDKVIFNGGYHRLDDNHTLLDPCLAHRS